MKAIAVIGANFGDEGKGRMTDHFASQAPSVVVRYNGGAQAGHTVVLPDGKRHVFSHFGAGTFVGAPTFLSHFFVVNPFLFVREAKLLPGAKIFMDPLAPLTTPWDMLINREVESHRGKSRHGSCGYGISETIERMVSGGAHKTTAADTVSPKILRDKLGKIRDEWVPRRLAALGITTPSEWYRNASTAPGLIDEYMSDCGLMSRACTPMLAYELTKRWDRVIFEGAQGLCLDEGHKFFPHVTRSRTGLANVAELCRIAGIPSIEAVYVSRAYLTRHGAGPLPTEAAGLSYGDATNVPNEWQGSLRFGHLDLDLLSESVRTDMAKCGALKVKCSLAMTCLDQIGDGATVKHKGAMRQITPADLPMIARQAVCAGKVYTSFGPSRT